MPHDAIRQWKSTGKTCTFSEYLDLIAPAQEEYIRKCTDGLTASAAHWAVNHQETWPYGLRDFTLGVVSSWGLDDVMNSKSYEEMPQKYGGSFDQAVERARQLGPPGGLPCTSPRNSWTSSAPRSMGRSVSGGHLGNPLLWKAWTQTCFAAVFRGSRYESAGPAPPLKNGKRSRRCSLFAERVKST